MSLSSWKNAQEVLDAASDPKKLTEIAEQLSTEEEKQYSRQLIALEKDEPLLKPNPRRWVRCTSRIISFVLASSRLQHTRNVRSVRGAELFGTLSNRI